MEKISNPQKEYIKPNYTIYIKNLNEKVKIELLKKLLYEMFGQFGKILDIVCSKVGNRRGQAFVVFDSIESAKNAIQKRNGTLLINKEMKINYAKTKSHTIAKLDGTFEDNILKRKIGKAYLASKVNNQSGEKPLTKESVEPPKKKRKIETNDETEKKF